MHHEHNKNLFSFGKKAGSLLRKEIQLTRKEKAWSERILPERIGIYRTTLRKIEAVDMTVAIGLVLEAVVIHGTFIGGERLKALLEEKETKLWLCLHRLLTIIMS